MVTSKNIITDFSKLDLLVVDPDQPVNCPDCQSRTQFTDYPDYQEHYCLNPKCDFYILPFYTKFEME